MTDPRPAPPRREPAIGPFALRRLSRIGIAAGITAGVLLVATRPVAPGPGSPTALPVSTPFLVGPAVEGLAPGELAPELEWTLEDGSTAGLDDLDGRPIRLAELRGRVVWLNFWATWCPPCQVETPVLREVAAAYRDRGVELVAVAVQETAPDEVRAYAERYDLDHVIGFDASADVFRRYRVFALPTQVFVDAGGRILRIVNGPVDTATVSAWLDAWLAAGG